MHSRFFSQFMAGALVVAVVAGGSLLLAEAANATQAPGIRGTLTFTPTSALNTEIITAHTSRGCDPQSNAADLEITGPVDSANPTFPPRTVVTSTENNTFSTTRGFDIPLGLSLKDSADILHKTIQPGEYHFTVVCQDQAFLTEFSTFTGAISFTDPTHYNSGDPSPPSLSHSPLSHSPSVSRSPSLSPSPTTSHGDTTTPASSASDSAGTRTSSDPAGMQPVASTGSSVNTGAPIALTFLGGLILLAAGLGLVIWLKRPRKRRH